MDVESNSVAMVLGAVEAMVSSVVSPTPFRPFHLFSHSRQHNFAKMDLKDQTLSQRVSSPKVSQCKCQDTNRSVGSSKHRPAGSSVCPAGPSLCDPLTESQDVDWVLSSL